MNEHSESAGGPAKQWISETRAQLLETNAHIQRLREDIAALKRAGADTRDAERQLRAHRENYVHLEMKLQRLEGNT